MTKYDRCLTCHGSGIVMGGGMLQQECEECDGRGKIKKQQEDIEVLQFKATDSYKNAVDTIKSADNKITQEQAENILNEELSRDKKEQRRDRIK